MQPKGPQNYWQPQDEPSSEPPEAPVTQPPTIASAPTSGPLPSSMVPVSDKSDTSPRMNITPHDQAFAAPSQDAHDHEDHKEEAAGAEPALSWEASEYIDHEKDILWFLGFSIVVLIFLGVAVWVQAWTFVVLIIIMAIATIVYVRRPPRTMRYSLSETGLHIGPQFHPYHEYRAFGVVDDGSFYAIMLVSTKRFMPATLIYFAEQDGDRIVDTLSTHLPMEDLDLDLADVIIRRLRL